MEFGMEKTEIFATPLWLHDFDDSASLAAISYLAEQALANEEKLKGSGLQKSNQGNSFHTQNNFLGEFAKTPLYGLLAPKLAAALADYGYKASSVRISYWSIVSRAGAYNRRHNHPDSILSVAFYTQAPPGSGNLIFSDPRYGKLMESNIGRTDHSISLHGHIKVVPKLGRLVVFPSYLEHEVELSTCDGARIIYSLNLSLG